MTIATGVAKQLRYKAESTWGTAPGASGAQLLRRVTSNLSLKKQTYQSDEITSDYQIRDMRHGVRSVEGTINGQLSPATYKDFFAAAVRQDFAAVSAITGLSLTIATSGSFYTITRGSGSWITDGIKVGNVGRITAGSVNAANSNKNLMVVALTATVMTVDVLNGVAMVAEGPIASCTFAVTGKKAYVPASSHTDKSFSIEHWHSDINQSELFTGCKVNQLDIGLPPTGMATFAAQMMGKDITTNTSAYYSSPTAETTYGLLAAVNGGLYVSGTKVANVTGLSLSIKGNMSADPVVGSNVYPDIFEGRVLVDGSLSVFFEDGTWRDYFINETEAALCCAFTTGSSATADFIAFCMPRIKVGGAELDDGQKGLQRTLPFTALRNTSGGSGTNSEDTTIVVQDSAA